MSTIYSTSPEEQIKELSRTIAELRQRVAALEAERWQPVEDGVYIGEDAQQQDTVVNGRALQSILHGYIMQSFTLPKGWRVCRLVAGQEGQGEAHAND